MIYLNGQFVPDEAAVVRVMDRGFLYGDGLFETVLARHGRLFRWRDHWVRLAAGATTLRIQLPGEAALHAAAVQLLVLNRQSAALLRIAVSRGVGTRGYSPRGADHPTVVITTHDAPPDRAESKPDWRLITATARLPKTDCLAGYKTANKLLQIIARAEADDTGADDALMLNSAGEIAETTSGNLFFIRGRDLITPPVSAGILPGITRRVVGEIAAEVGVVWQEATCSPADLPKWDGSFVSLTSLGVIPVRQIDEQRFPPQPIICELARQYQLLVDRETRSTSG